MTEPEPPTPKRTAGLLVAVHPIGEPGKVGITITNAGPQKLTPAEALDTLRAAVNMLELMEPDDL